MNIRGHAHSTDSDVEAERQSGRKPSDETCIFGTVVLDGMGRIVSCGDAAELMFGERAARLRGRNVAEFVGGLCLGGSSSRYRAGYLDYLSRDSRWRENEVQDSDGRKFVTAFKLSPIVAEGQRLFLLAMQGMGKGEPQAHSTVCDESDA
jgi:PAS domain S-box-containing protein